MKKTFLLFFCLFLTSCSQSSNTNAVSPEPTNYISATPVTQVTPNGKMETNSTIHILGRVTNITDEYYILQMFASVFQQYSGSFHIALNKNCIKTEISEQLTIECAENMFSIVSDTSSGEFPTEFSALIANPKEYIVVIDDVKKVEKIENDGVTKGTITSSALVVDEKWSEVSGSINIVNIDKNEPEGNVSIQYNPNLVESDNSFIKDNVIIYYNPETYVIYKVENSNSDTDSTD